MLAISVKKIINASKYNIIYNCTCEIIGHACNIINYLYTKNCDYHNSSMWSQMRKTTGLMKSECQVGYIYIKLYNTINNAMY